MAIDRQPSNPCSLRSLRTFRPEINSEFDFESSESGGVDPGLAVDGPTDDGTTDARTSSDLTDTVLVGEGSEFESEESSDLGHGVGTDLVGPVTAETAWCESHGAGHDLSIRASYPVTLLSTNTDVTGQTYGVLSKQHKVRLGATVAKYIERYTPDIPEAHWAAIGDFVRSVITDLEPELPVMARKALGTVTAITHWAWQVGIELDRTTIFDRFAIEEFIAVGYPRTWSIGTRRNIRAQLFTISRALLGDAARIPRLNPLPGHNPTAPYNAEEIATLRSWAKGQGTFGRRRDATVILALGAGAGLKPEDSDTLRRRDIVEFDGYVIVNVGGNRPRQVPVMAEWEDDLREAMSTLSPDDFVYIQGRKSIGKNTINFFVSRSNGTFKPKTTRLRATWIVHHLTAGTYIKTLMVAAGVHSADTFLRYLQFVPDVSVDEARRLLRGS